MKKIFSMVLLAIGLTCFSFVVYAESWKSFDDRSNNYYDEDSLIKADNKITVWVKTTDMPRKDRSKLNVHYIKYNVVLDCTMKSIVTNSILYYDMSDNLIKQEVFNNNQRAPVPIIFRQTFSASKNMGEKLYEALCTP